MTGCVNCRRPTLIAKRGLCRRCREAMRAAVGRGETTWEEIEAAGRALPDARRRPRRYVRRQ